MTKNYDEWNDEYFSKYKNAFLQSSEVTTKNKQKTFSKLSKEEQTKWYNKAFYSYVDAIEAEKIKYFGLVYKQNTLVVVAPDENKGQEQFLGYKWSNRKGQEGIQIMKLGGELYKPDNRIANDVASGLVRNAFADKQLDVAELSDKYYYLRTQDMLDFSGVTFNKAIKTTKTRILKQDKGLTNYSLSNSAVFELMIGDRVLSTDIVEDGEIPVYSANVHEEFGRINKKNITDFSRPSVVWGIDGDWMVDYIPENKPFYPTDHCGVIRIKNDNILPKYLVYALKVEGEYERFSRSNRASTQRIASLIIQVPELAVQKKIVAEMEAIDKQVNDEENKLKKYDEDIKSKFVEMFGSAIVNEKKFIIKRLEEVCEYITDGSHISPQNDSNGNIPMLSVKDMTNMGFDYGSCKYISLKDYNLLKKNGCQPKIGDILIAKDGSYFKYAFVVYEERKEVILSSIAMIHPKELLLPEYLKFYLLSDEVYQFVKQELITGMALKRVILDDIKRIPIFVPSLNEQKLFASYVNSIDKLRFAMPLAKSLNTLRPNSLTKNCQITEQVASKWTNKKLPNN